MSRANLFILLHLSFFSPTKGLNGYQSFTCIGDVSIAVADLNNDGVDDIINASDGGRMSAYSCGKREKLWTLDNCGFGYSCIALTHEKTPVLVISSDSGYMFFVDPFNGVVQSYVDVGEPVKTFSVTDSNKIIAGTQNGSVVLIVDAKLSNEPISEKRY
ncbi:MAG: hypothetical protein J7K65_03495 [Planctomycetes bacterium]|nr:hypothetical protein [Planctomycetota bacterium]